MIRISILFVICSLLFFVCNVVTFNFYVFFFVTFNFYVFFFEFINRLPYACCKRERERESFEFLSRRTREIRQGVERFLKRGNVRNNSYGDENRRGDVEEETENWKVHHRSEEYDFVESVCGEKRLFCEYM